MSSENLFVRAWENFLCLSVFIVMSPDQWINYMNYFAPVVLPPYGVNCWLRDVAHGNWD